TLTLTTCYPFDYIGDAPDRYIIEASLLSIH
ncbi:class D sortase, partial [Bacillus sp. ZZQ-131]